MGLHSLGDDTRDHSGSDDPSRRRRRREGRRGRGRRIVTLVLVLVLLLGGGGLTAVALTGTGDRIAAAVTGREPLRVYDDVDADEADAGCTEVVQVWVVSGDDLAPALQVLDSAPLGPDADGVCADVQAVGQGAAETLELLTSGLDSPRRADVWIPDSTLWAARAQEAEVAVESLSSLGTSPVVVASNPVAMAATGWDAAPPTWSQVLGAEHPLAVPDLRGSASTVLALAAARGAEASPEAALMTVRTVLARQRVGSLTPSEGLVMAATGGAEAPLVLTSEQDVMRRTAGADAPALLAVAPTDGTPVLDYPVLAVPAVAERTPADEAAVQMVLDALTGAPGQAAAAAAGLRGPDLEPLPGAPTLVRASEPYVYPDPAAVAAVVTDLERLSPPSQLLVVVDVSLSMSAEVGDGFTRVDVAADALGRALGDLPDPTRVSLWEFASDLQPDSDHVEVLPSRRLDAAVDGRTQRDLLADAVVALPGSLVDGGTSLYDTTEAALRAAREQWDPGTVSTVVVITDGRNEDSTGLDLPGLQARLAEQADPERPVGLVAVAFGPDADLAALEQVAAAAQAGGPSQAVNARNPEVLRGLLVQLLAARTAATG